jgi:hypothetical protein
MDSKVGSSSSIGTLIFAPIVQFVNESLTFAYLKQESIIVREISHFCGEKNLTTFFF